MAVDGQSGEILVAEVTTNDYHDSEILAELLNGIEGKIEQVSADGGYDNSKCYEAIEQREARATIPSRKNPQRWEDGDGERNKNLDRIKEIGRKEWKEKSGYQ